MRGCPAPLARESLRRSYASFSVSGIDTLCLQFIIDQNFSDLYKLSENDLHFATRAKLVEYLKECQTLDVHINCSKRGRFWRCNSSKTIKRWSKDWERVETGNSFKSLEILTLIRFFSVTEFTVAGVKADIVLMKRATTSLKALGEQALRDQATFSIVFPEDVEGDQQEEEEDRETDEVIAKGTHKEGRPNKQKGPPPIEELKEKHKSIWEHVKTFHEALQQDKKKDSVGCRKEWSLPPSPSPARYAAHRFAEELGFYSYSIGSGSKRVVILSNFPRLQTADTEAHVRLVRSFFFQ